MSNVYGYLSDSSHQVLSFMLCLSGKHSQAELAYFNDMEALEIEAVIREIRTTTMFTISSNAYESSLESRYELSDLARDYLSRHHPASPQAEAKFKKKQRQLTAAIEVMNAEQVDDPYSFYNISRSTQSHTIIAIHLKGALDKAKREDFEDADKILAKARNLAPVYFEVYRVEASVKVQQGNYSAARAAYETALELNSNHAPLLYWFASFLLRYQDDAEKAYEEFKKAEKLNPVDNDTAISVDIKDRLHGTVDRLFAKQKFGFIRADNGEIYHFQESDMPKSRDWQKLQVGDKVVFWKSKVKVRAGQRSHAIDVMIRNQ
jgi:tetratricopeptide (TPR) repeat protein